MKIVFIKDLPHSGKKGDIKEVPDGFARNYLIPQGIAVAANLAVIEEVQNQTKATEHRENKEKEELMALAEKINGLEIVFKAKGGGKDRIHGSITNSDVASRISEIIGHQVDKKKIILEEPLRVFGNHEVVVNWVKGKDVKVRVVIEEE